MVQIQCILHWLSTIARVVLTKGIGMRVAGGNITCYCLDLTMDFREPPTQVKPFGEPGFQIDYKHFILKQTDALTLSCILFH